MDMLATYDLTGLERISVAGFLAGSVGTSNYDQPDDRRVKGWVDVEPSGDGTSSTLTFDLTVTVFDVIDFAPERARRRKSASADESTSRP